MHVPERGTRRFATVHGRPQARVAKAPGLGGGNFHIVDQPGLAEPGGGEQAAVAVAPPGGERQALARRDIVDLVEAGADKRAAGPSVAPASSAPPASAAAARRRMALSWRATSSSASPR